MTDLAPWLLLISGAILLTLGLFNGWRTSGRAYLVLGLTCVIPAGAFLLNNSGSALGTPALILSAIWIVGILVVTRNVSMRRVLRDARYEVLFGGMTAAALLMTAYLPASTSSAVRWTLIVATSIFAVSFIAATVVRMRGSDALGRSNH